MSRRPPSHRTTLYCRSRRSCRQGRHKGKRRPAPAMPHIRKRSLSQLYPAVFQQLASSTDAQKQQILSFGAQLDRKQGHDGLLHKSRVRDICHREWCAAGDVYQLPENFNGDYLAIANADMNSDKSELYMAQDVNYERAQSMADGTSRTVLIIKRTHNGNQSPNWWYQTTNQDYMEDFSCRTVARSTTRAAASQRMFPHRSTMRTADMAPTRIVFAIAFHHRTQLQLSESDDPYGILETGDGSMVAHARDSIIHSFVQLFA